MIQTLPCKKIASFHRPNSDIFAMMRMRRMLLYGFLCTTYSWECKNSLRAKTSVWSILCKFMISLIQAKERKLTKVFFTSFFISKGRGMYPILYYVLTYAPNPSSSSTCALSTMASISLLRSFPAGAVLHLTALPLVRERKCVRGRESCIHICKDGV